MISLFFVYAASIISNLIFTAVQSVFNVELKSVDFTAEKSAFGFFTNILFLMIAAPICEELFFRGVLTSRVSKYGEVAAAVTTGIMFGLFHVNYEQFLYASILGFCTAMLFIKTRSIIPSLILHLSLNTLGTIQSIALSDVDLEKLSQSDTEYILSHTQAILTIALVVLVIIVIMVIGLIFLISELRNLKQQFKSKDNTGISELKKIRIYFQTPITIGTVVILIAFAVFNAIG